MKEMKFNLKNRPTVFAEKKELIKWFEGFEKELREMLQKYFELHHFIARDVIEDILGETKE